MSSAYNFVSIEADEIEESDLSTYLDRVENDLFEAEEWERGYASEVDRLRELKEAIEHRIADAGD